jgi:mRNA-degrading endonuclease RelE of RelBE toxin-antitoxin system
MLHIYLSDRAIRDLKLYANMAPKCLAALEDAIARYDSINELLKKTRVPEDVDIKRLRCQPTAWRHHFGDYRSIFTVSKAWGTDSIQVLRIAPRSNVYKRLASYLQASFEIEKLWKNPEPDEDKMLDEQVSEQKALSRSKKDEDDRYVDNCRLQVHQLRGSAGTGKTTSALDLAIEAIEQGIYPIVIVPNKLLQKFGEDYITKNYQSLTICKNLSQAQLNKETPPTKLAILTKDQILQYLAGDEREAWSSTVGNIRIRTYLQEMRVIIPEYLKNINLYNLFLGYVGSDYTQNNIKDALLKEFSQGIEFINQLNYHQFIKRSLDNRDAISQANRAMANRKKFIEVMIQLTGYSEQSEDSDTFDCKVPILIIDEVQDFYWSQLQALIEFYIIRFPMDDRTSLAPTVCHLSDELKVSWESVSKHAGRLIILAGDNNQRVNFSGFSWEHFATAFVSKFPNYAPPVAPKAFLKNYRNTQQITKAANYILSAQRTETRAFALDTNGSWITSPPSPEYSRRGNTTPRLIKADKEWVTQLVDQLKNSPKTEQMDDSDRFVFIYDEISYEYKESQGGDKLLFLNVAEAKGQEFNAVIIMFPFSLNFEKPSVSQLFKWYTALTRAREYVALLLSPMEWDWLHKQVINSSDLDSVFAKRPSLSVDKFIEELYTEGRSSLTNQQKITVTVNDVFKKIEAWLLGTQKLSYLLEEIERNNLMVWEVLDAIEDRDNRFTPNLSRLSNISFENSSPLEALVIYLAILPILVEMEISNISAIDTQVIDKLEQYFKQDPEGFDLAKSEVKNPVSLCLIYRANRYSGQAATEIENCSSDQVKRFLLNQINQDLIKRDLSWEASRLRYRYFGEEPSQNLPYRELMRRDEYLPRMLLDRIFEDISESSK